MGKTSSAVKNRYNSKAYDRINFVVPNGQREIIQQHAESMGESTNAFILRAVMAAMAQDKRGDGTPAAVWE